MKDGVEIRKTGQKTIHARTAENRRPYPPNFSTLPEKFFDPTPILAFIADFDTNFWPK